MQSRGLDLWSSGEEERLGELLYQPATAALQTTLKFSDLQQ